MVLSLGAGLRHQMLARPRQPPPLAGCESDCNVFSSPDSLGSQHPAPVKVTHNSAAGSLRNVKQNRKSVVFLQQTFIVEHVLLLIIKIILE